MTKRRTSSRISSQKKKQKLVVPSWDDSAAGRLGFILELGTISIWAFLAGEDISSLIQVCRAELSEDFVEELSLKALDQFALENQTNIGHQCNCDWIQPLDGFSHGSPCTHDKYSVNKSMQLLQAPGGAKELLHALALAKRMLLPYCVDDGSGNKQFSPVVHVLTKEKEGPWNKAAVTKAMNLLYKRSGLRFFYKFNIKRAYKPADFVDEHWDYIAGSTCNHCANLHSEDQHRLKWRSQSIERIRANCKKVYRPLKAVMEKELQFVRFIPRSRASYSRRGTRYEGLVAGVTPTGVFCGLYLKDGFWPYNRSR